MREDNMKMNQKLDGIVWTEFACLGIGTIKRVL